MAKNNWRVESGANNSWGALVNTAITVDQDTIILYDSKGKVAVVYCNTGQNSNIKSAVWRNNKNNASFIYITYEDGYTEGYDNGHIMPLFRNDTGDILSLDYAQPEDHVLKTEWESRRAQGKPRNKESKKSNSNLGLFGRIKRFAKRLFWGVIITFIIYEVLQVVI